MFKLGFRVKLRDQPIESIVCSWGHCPERFGLGFGFYVEWAACASRDADL